ncbi:DUF2935 domain-containing protein [Clostridium autoethanogenum]|uniref:DUF2935 domain-containing protein n=2 Tax=Clostridium autoethanogenum TaxID=84023 RepID=A0A3M0S1Y9_9CLOT|nr:DUF2935 domain-containing protein [Clostridium autoethanogenum]AGY76070.1 DUF2935 domain-containing protein [Clostridium autoethanogenum DSM 10061]ALU36232.1 hypothetical protein CLAU_1803 [Clostridium autoethanogenum DSM 10061]OVY48793.1 hypothetical protein WX72_00182 [Clostridium autoethanogenum]RMC92572.1 DUF2935 domain-containing protein [Clostridium autoethanogenum]
MPNEKQDLLFWTGIMRDHAIFQNSALTSKEVPYIQKTIIFRNFFQKTMDKIESKDNFNENTPGLIEAVNDFINFKVSILKGLLTCKLEMNLPPTLISHQINEAMEFRLQLMYPEDYLKSIQDPIHFIELLNKWISDSSGHASAYASFLDPTESILSAEALEFKMKFDMLSVKGNELQMMMMQSESGNEALMLLIEEIEKVMKKFILYLQEILKLRSSCEVMAIGTLNPLLPDHMIREHKYYLDKINNYMKSKKC